jgi:hypothetical protein
MMKYFSHKFLRRFPPRFKTLVSIIVRGGLKGLTPTQIFREVVTQDTFDQYEVDEVKEDDKKNKSKTFKASSTKGKKKKEESSDDGEGSRSSIDEEEMALFVRKFGKIMKKVFGGSGRMRRSPSKRKEERR